MNCAVYCLLGCETIIMWETYLGIFCLNSAIGNSENIPDNAKEYLNKTKKIGVLCRNKCINSNKKAMQNPWLFVFLFKADGNDFAFRQTVFFD